MLLQYEYCSCVSFFGPFIDSHTAIIDPNICMWKCMWKSAKCMWKSANGNIRYFRWRVVLCSLQVANAD